MGYYTTYNLNIHSTIMVRACEHGDTDSKFCSRCGVKQEKLPIWEIAVKRLIEIVGYNPLYESCKWYEHEQDMVRLSSEFPQILFTLEGEGEDNHDIWKKYFKKGKIQICTATIIFEEFHETMLKNIDSE